MNLLGKVDSLLIIPERPPQARDGPEDHLRQRLAIADDVLRQAVLSISELIKNTGFINPTSRT